MREGESIIPIQFRFLSFRRRRTSHDDPPTPPPSHRRNIVEREDYDYICRKKHWRSLLVKNRINCAAHFIPLLVASNHQNNINKISINRRLRARVFRLFSIFTRKLLEFITSALTNVANRDLNARAMDLLRFGSFHYFTTLQQGNNFFIHKPQ